MSSGDRSLREDLARYMDNEAFTAKKIGKHRAELMERRRAYAKLRADAALRFFKKSDQRERLDRWVASQEKEPVT